jgi:hypothetical protein
MPSPRRPGPRTGAGQGGRRLARAEPGGAGSWGPLQLPDSDGRARAPRQPASQPRHGRRRMPLRALGTHARRVAATRPCGCGSRSPRLTCAATSRGESSYLIPRCNVRGLVSATRTVPAIRIRVGWRRWRPAFGLPLHLGFRVCFSRDN